MINGIIGRKLGMTQIFTDAGKAETVTLVEAGPCVVLQVKNAKTDGYNAAQLGFGKAKHITKAEKGHCKELGEFKHLREFRLPSVEGVAVGDKVDAGSFQVGDKIKISGTSKGRGFAGVVKRHKFKGGPKTHGQSDRHRAPGSIGSTTTPGRVLKGRRMAGHMGDERVTVRNVEVIRTDAERNTLMVRGPVPGAAGGLVIIAKLVGRSK
jgi:large subunit ribosomal protein L3